MNFTNEEIATLRASFMQLIPVTEQLSADFYSKMFQEHPELRPLFKPDMQSQQDKLIDTLAALLDVLNKPDVAENALHDLGKRHVAYGATPATYAWVEANLQLVMAQHAGEEAFEAIKPLWAKLLSFVTKTMLEGAK